MLYEVITGGRLVVFVGVKGRAGDAIACIPLGEYRSGAGITGRDIVGVRKPPGLGIPVGFGIDMRAVHVGHSYNFV